MADRIGVMYLGSLVELGTAPDIASHPLHPYTQALFCASGMMSNVPEDCRILKGDIPDPAAPPGGCPFHTRCYLCQPVCRKIKPPLLKWLSVSYAMLSLSTCVQEDKTSSSENGRRPALCLPSCTLRKNINDCYNPFQL